MTLNSFDIIKERVVRDGKVAVLVSPGYGAGWYTWNRDKEFLLFEPKVVEMVLNKVYHGEIDHYVESTYGDDFYLGGSQDLVVEWVPVGARFRIHEYDGSESLVLESEEQWVTA
jgi:hypothetical protein